MNTYKNVDIACSRSLKCRNTRQQLLKGLMVCKGLARHYLRNKLELNQFAKFNFYDVLTC